MQVARHRLAERSNDEEAFKAKTKSQVAKWRKRENSSDRLKAFREGTLHGPDFICVSCGQRMFNTNVMHFNKFIELKSKNNIDLEKFIEDFVNVSKEKDQQYICKTCTNYISKNKLPPSSVKMD